MYIGEKEEDPSDIGYPMPGNGITGTRPYWGLDDLRGNSLSPSLAGRIYGLVQEHPDFFMEKANIPMQTIARMAAKT